jgi:hypothetical protein
LLGCEGTAEGYLLGPAGSFAIRVRTLSHPDAYPVYPPVRTRPSLLIGLLVLVAPATGEAGPRKAARAAKTSPHAPRAGATTKKLLDLAAQAREHAEAFVASQGVKLDDRLCICKDNRYPNGLGKLQVVMPAPTDHFHYARLICSVKGGSTEHPGLIGMNCQQFEVLELVQ